MSKLSFPLLALSMLAVVGCSGSSSPVTVDTYVLYDDDVIKEGDLTEIACDFKVYPLKSDIPLDGVGGIKCWGNKAFARSNDNKRLLCFENYKLYAVLDKLGRGPGEYLYLSDYTYDEKENLLYIGNDSIICVYDAGTTDFIRKQYINYDTQNLLNVGDKMLYLGMDIDESRKRQDDINYNPIQSVILAERGDWELKGPVKVLTKYNYFHRVIFGYPEVFYVNPKNLSFCIPGPVNRIVTFDFDSDTVTDVFKFRIESNDNMTVTKYQDEESFEGVAYNDLMNDYVSMILGGHFLDNVYNIIVDDGTISFRADYTTAEDSWSVDESDVDNGYLYWVHNKSGTKVYKSLRIPGLLKNINPTGCHDNRNVAVIENLGEDAIDELSEMSPLAKQIVAELKKQNDENPVVLEFRFK